MPQPRGILSILPGRIALLTARDGSWETRTAVGRAHAETHQGWLESLRSSEGALRASIDEAGLAGMTVDIIYDSLTQQVDLRSPARRNPYEAHRASVALAREAFESEEEPVLVSAVPLRSGKGPPVYLTAADLGESVEEIYEFVMSVGLHPRRIVPAAASVLASAAESGAEDGVVARAVLGECAAFLVVSDGGRVCFSRRLSVHVDALIEAIAQAPTGLHRGDLAPADLLEKAERAREALFGVGLNRSAEDAAPPGFLAADIAAAIQPVAQRLEREIRQAIRFGLTEERRAHVRLHLVGPGFRTPGLSEALFAGLHVERAEAPPAAEEIDHPLNARLALASRAQQSGAAIGARKRWIMAGGVAAVLIAGGEHLRLTSEIDSLRARLAQQEAESRAQDGVMHVARTLSDSVGRFNRIVQRVEQHSPASVSAAATLSGIATLLPEGAIITMLDVRDGGGAAVGSISGVMRAEDGSSEQRIAAFARTLSDSPMFRAARLQGVSTTPEGAVQFSIRFEPQPIPDVFVRALADEMGDRP